MDPPPDKPETMDSSLDHIAHLPPAPSLDEAPQLEPLASKPSDEDRAEGRIATAESNEAVTLFPDTRELESQRSPVSPSKPVSLPADTNIEATEPEAVEDLDDYTNGSGSATHDENDEEHGKIRSEEGVQPNRTAETKLASHSCEARTPAPAQHVPVQHQNPSPPPNLPNLPNLPIIDSDNRELNAEGSLSSRDGEASEGGTDEGSDLPDDDLDADADDVDDGSRVGDIDATSASDPLGMDSGSGLDSPALSDELTASILEDEYAAGHPAIPHLITPVSRDEPDDRESFTEGGDDHSLRDSGEDQPASPFDALDGDHWATMDDLIDRALADRPPPRAQGASASAFESLTPWEFADEAFTGSEGEGVSDEECELEGEDEAVAEGEPEGGVEGQGESESGSDGEEGFAGTVVGGSLDDAFAVAMGLRVPEPAEALTFHSRSACGRGTEGSATEDTADQTEEESDFDGSADGGHYGAVFDKVMGIGSHQTIEASALPSVVRGNGTDGPEGSTSGSDDDAGNNVEEREEINEDSSDQSEANSDDNIGGDNNLCHSDAEASGIDNLVHSIITTTSTPAVVPLSKGQFPVEDDLANASADLNTSRAIVNQDDAASTDGSYSDASSVVDGAGALADASGPTDIDLDGLLDILAAMDGRHSAKATLAAHKAAPVPEEGAAKDTTAASDNEDGQEARSVNAASSTTASAIIPPTTMPSSSTKPTRPAAPASSDATSSLHSLLTLLEHTTTTLESAKTTATSALSWAALLYAAFLWIDAVAPPTRALPVALQVALLMPAWAVVGGTAVYGACFVLRYPLVGAVVVAVLLGANVGREEKGPFLPRVGDVAWV